MNDFVASTLADLQRIVAEGRASITPDGKSVTVPMAMMDSTQRAIAADAQARAMNDRLEAARDHALQMQKDRFASGHRHQDARHPATGRFTPGPSYAAGGDPGSGAGDPDVVKGAQSLATGTVRSEAEAAREAEIAQRGVVEAMASHAAPLAARKRRYATGYLQRRNP